MEAAMGDESSFTYRAFLPEQDLADLRAMLEQPAFVDRMHARTPRLSHAIRFAIALGLEELERAYQLR